MSTQRQQKTTGIPAAGAHVKPGHDSPEVERVVEVKPSYAIVEKFGASGADAVRLDPRKPSSSERVSR